MNIILNRSFIKRLSKVPKHIRIKFIERKNLFIEAPFHTLLNNHSVDKRFLGCRSINITGDYRAIFEEHGKDIIFVNIGTHSELYS